MQLGEEIDRIRQNALQALDRSHDYFTFTKRSWRLIQTTVERRGQKFSFRNLETNTTIDQNEFIAKAQQYISEELSEATFQQFVSVFEVFVYDLLKTWMRAYPESLSKRQLTGKEVLALPDRESIIEALAAKELNEIFYDRPSNWFVNIKERMGVETSGTDEFAEIKATRDILVHAKGIANAQYVLKAGNLARASIGDRLQISEPYLQESWRLVRKLTDDIGSKAAAKFAAGT